MKANEVKLKVPPISYYGTGKRKCAIAKVWLFEGEGLFSVNSNHATDYFGSELDTTQCLLPLTALDLTKKYNVRVTVLGGGKSAQIGACILGISRALLNISSEYREKLKKSGFLTRDPRVKERKKYGLRGARKAPQFRKR